MSAPEPQPAPAPHPASQWRGLELENYLWSNRDRFTADALARSAHSAGYTDEEIATATQVVERRRADELAAKPVKARARRYVLVGYAVTFAVFAIGFLRPTFVEGFYRGSGPVALAILGFMLLMALLLGLVWVNSRHPAADRAEAAFGAMLVVPFLLLVIISGLCVVTTPSILFAPPA